MNKLVYLVIGQNLPSIGRISSVSNISFSLSQHALPTATVSSRLPTSRSPSTSAKLYSRDKKNPETNNLTQKRFPAGFLMTSTQNM